MGLLCMGYVYVYFVYGVWVCVSVVVYGGIEVWGIGVGIGNRGIGV